MFQISQLFIYPVKGIGGIALDSSFVTSRGLKYDRRWMLIDESNQFISQRTFPELCLFKVEMHEQGFLIAYKNNSIDIPFEISEGELIQVQIWDDQVFAIVADDNLNTFFSKQLNYPCRLVYMPESTHRLVDSNYVKHNTSVSFADGYPVLIIGQASLNLLNEKLDEPIEMNRFRPNIVFTGGTAHVEDLWCELTVGTTIMQGVKPCGRCQVTTINQQTGVIAKEPLKTLATYRNFNNKINFGQNTIVLKEGKISLNDQILIVN